MWPSNLKLYLYAASFVVAIGFILRYDYVVEQNKTLKSDVEKYQLNEAKVKKQIEDADLSRTEYLTNLQAAQNEIDTLRNSVSSGATVLRVKATCPKLPSTSADTAGAITASPELTEDARSNYYAHRSDENELNARLDLCIKTLQDERK